MKQTQSKKKTVKRQYTQFTDLQPDQLDVTALGQIVLWRALRGAGADFDAKMSNNKKDKGNQTNSNLTVSQG
jgi:hypothetical protein